MPVQPELDLSAAHGPCEFVELLAHQPGLLTPALHAAVKRLLAATAAENRGLFLRVRELEAELDRSAAELARLRTDLHGAVHDALTDPLTGLANRRSFDLELEALSGRARSASPAHLVMVDIDHFKRINDIHGHDLGDSVLRVVGEIFRANVRRESLIARLGGDEFGLLLADASPRAAAAIARRLCRFLTVRPLVLPSNREIALRITVSAGVAGWRRGEAGAQWYARADAALYKAKRAGRNRIRIARPAGTTINSDHRCKSGV